MVICGAVLHPVPKEGVSTVKRRDSLEAALETIHERPPIHGRGKEDRKVNGCPTRLPHFDMLLQCVVKKISEMVLPLLKTTEGMLSQIT